MFEHAREVRWLVTGSVIATAVFAAGCAARSTLGYDVPGVGIDASDAMDTTPDGVIDTLSLRVPDASVCCNGWELCGCCDFMISTGYHCSEPCPLDFESFDEPSINCDGQEDCVPGSVCCIVQRPGGRVFDCAPQDQCVPSGALACRHDRDCSPLAPHCCAEFDYVVCSASPCAYDGGVFRPSCR